MSNVRCSGDHDMNALHVGTQAWINFSILDDWIP